MLRRITRDGRPAFTGDEPTEAAPGGFCLWRRMDNMMLTPSPVSEGPEAPPWAQCPGTEAPHQTSDRHGALWRGWTRSPVKRDTPSRSQTCPEASELERADLASDFRTHELESQSGRVVVRAEREGRAGRRPPEAV